MEYRVVQDGKAIEVQLTLQDYWKYIEDGTRPHFPPLDRILEWIRVKPVIPRPDDKGRIPTPQQLAYLIGRKINEEGTEGSKDLHDALEVINAEYRERIAAALGHDMQNYIRKIVAEK